MRLYAALRLVAERMKGDTQEMKGIMIVIKLAIRRSQGISFRGSKCEGTPADEPFPKFEFQTSTGALHQAFTASAPPIFYRELY